MARKQVEWCMICESAPCECTKKSTKPATPRRARTDPVAPVPTDAPPAQTERPATVLRRPTVKPAAVDTRSFADIQRTTEEEEMRHAIFLLRHTLGAVEVLEESPEQRAAAWRARRWKERHAPRS